VDRVKKDAVPEAEQRNHWAWDHKLMTTPSLREALQNADREHIALGHFNFSELVVLKAVATVARELNVPVLVGVSESEREFVGVRQAAVLVKSIREESGMPVFLNADHTHSLEKALEVARAGFDMIVFDASARPLDENVKGTRATVEAVKSLKPDIVVEGEIGYIGTSSAIHTSMPTDLSPLTTAEEAEQFVKATGIDALAPAVGTMHGMLKSMVSGEERKHLDIDRIAEIKRATGVFLTLHGGSGSDDDDLRKAVAAGIDIIHINTELRVAWRRGLERGLADKPDEVVPYKILPHALEAVRQVVLSRLRLFTGKQETAQGR
jgi:fructose-bisphosphate aldolase class II